MYLPINDLIFSFYAPTHLKQNKTKMNQKLVSSPQACARDIPKSFMFTDQTHQMVNPIQDQQQQSMQTSRKIYVPNNCELSTKYLLEGNFCLKR